MFSAGRNIVVKGPPEVWLGRRSGPDLWWLPGDAGRLARAHPEALDPGDIHTLYHRRIGLLVRRLLRAQTGQKQDTERGAPFPKRRVSDAIFTDLQADARRTAENQD